MTDIDFAAAFHAVTGRVLGEHPTPPKTDHDLALEDLAAARAENKRDEAYYEGLAADRLNDRLMGGAA
ncbi:MAG: hypothetical protein ACXVGA_06800 [Mycobacteriaceae bacterium]